MPKDDLTGRVFGSLTVVKESGRTPDKLVLWLCQCECGNTAIVRGKCLRSGHTKSCGCLVNKTIGSLNLTHGMKRSPEYRAWTAMKQRCSNPNNSKYDQYGGRGIKVCERWENSFEAFYADMGRRPGVGYSLDRIRVNEGYEPGNCRWATDETQSTNKTTTKYVDSPWGRISLKEAARKSGINYYTLKSRLAYSYSTDKLFTKD